MDIKERTRMDLKDIVGSTIIDGIEGGRSDSFAALTIKLKNGKIYFLYGQKTSNIEVTDKRMHERELQAVYKSIKRESEKP